MPAISVIVPARNAEATLPALLDALRDQHIVSTYEVIVVDDGSTDATPALVEAAGRPFRLVRSTASAGAGAARNLGAASATAPVLAFTDADCAPIRSWLEEGLSAIRGHDLVQGAVRPDPERAGGSPYERSLEVTYERGFYETANILVTRALFDHLGGFEDWLPPVGGRPQGEDTLFGWSARRSGARITFSDRALVHHAVIPQSRSAWVRDRWRWQVLPSLVARVPELRTQTLYRRWFFEHRTAFFDVALLGVVLAALVRRRWPLLLTGRYLLLVVEEARRLPPPDGLVYGATRLVADAVSFAALLRGSLLARSLVL